MKLLIKETADMYQDFFNFLSKEHGLICTIEEMDEIIFEAQKFSKKTNSCDEIFEQASKINP